MCCRYRQNGGRDAGPRRLPLIFMGQPVRVGILGCGNVGGPLVELLQRRGDEIAARTGLQLEIAAVAVRSASKERSVALRDDLLTTDAAAVVGDPSIDVIVDQSVTPVGTALAVLYSNAARNAVEPVRQVDTASVAEVDGSCGSGPLNACRLG